MVRHIVLWNFNENISKEEREINSKKIKADVEILKKVVDGIIDIKVYIDPLSSSNADIMLDSLFENEEALINYQNHPEHKKVGAFIKGLVCNKKCFDSVE